MQESMLHAEPEFRRPMEKDPNDDRGLQLQYSQHVHRLECCGRLTVAVQRGYCMRWFSVYSCLVECSAVSLA